MKDIDKAEREQFTYHREAAFRAPWTGTDAYGHMRRYNKVSREQWSKQLAAKPAFKR
jgi:hypothetical protein